MLGFPELGLHPPPGSTCRKSVESGYCAASRACFAEKCITPLKTTGQGISRDRNLRGTGQGCWAEQCWWQMRKSARAQGQPVEL